MNPIITETVQTRGAIVPTTPEMPPKLNITNAGDPAAMNTTCHQLTSLRIPCAVWTELALTTPEFFDEVFFILSPRCLYLFRSSVLC